MLTADSAREIAAGHRPPAPEPTKLEMTGSAVLGRAEYKIEEASKAGKTEIEVFAGDDWSDMPAEDRTAVRDRVVNNLQQRGFKVEPLNDMMAMRISW